MINNRNKIKTDLILVSIFTAFCIAGIVWGASHPYFFLLICIFAGMGLAMGIIMIRVLIYQLLGWEQTNENNKEQDI